MYPNVEYIIKRVQNNSYYNSSNSWREFTQHLEKYLISGDLDLYLINNIEPHVFTWPQQGVQNMRQLNILESDRESIFYKTLKVNDYGPKGIYLHNNIQLDRVQQVWSIYNLVTKCNLSLNTDEIIFEFGAGTGQMADVLSDLKFAGKHIIYDLPLMTVLQKYFIDKKSIKNTYILDDEPTTIINGTNFLPCNQPNSETHVLELPNINFIATYSLTETDITTRNKFIEYMVAFSRIYIVYWPGKTEVGDHNDNSDYIQMIQHKIDKTHYWFHSDNFENGKVFMAVKKTILLY
jgi:hypothetical protein